MNKRIDKLQLEETKKEDSPRYTKEAGFKMFKQKKAQPAPSSRHLSQSPLNPLFVSEPRDTEVKSSGSRCIIM